MSEVMENKGLSISVDDGSERVPVLNKQGKEIGVFFFNPTDLGIIDRYNEVVKKFPEVLEPLANVNIDANGESDDDESIAALGEAKEKLFELCDYLFGGNFAEAFFGTVHPFSPVSNGLFYCENAISAVGDFITNRFAGRVLDIHDRVEKYTKSYTAQNKPKLRKSKKGSS